jgi:dienelactone hydrolase
MSEMPSRPQELDQAELSIDRRTLLRGSLLALVASGWLPREAVLGNEPATTNLAPPGDRRLGKLLNFDGYFPFRVPDSLEAWEKRAQQVRRQVLVATGLWPMPPRPPIQPTIHGRVERNGCTIDRVFFESTPGLFVTGSLYRPIAGEGQRPLVLCPHGHWLHGRFFAHDDEAMAEELAKGGERYPKGGRYPLQARCFQLAKLGCVVFHYDMLGYADSAPISANVAHLFKKQRPEMSQPDRWGLFSAQAELRLLSPLGLQTFHSIRALDFALSLPDVDPTRVGVTGASGGGTQTFLLMAVDERPTAAFPAVMVSTKMQGGCTCENASYLRVGTGNIELAALTAPRPLGMSAADDWTKELETLGLPELRKLYEMMGVPDRVEGKYFPFPHNYNYPSRAMMYEFFNKHLALGSPSPVVETDFEPLTQDELTVWNEEHPAPPRTDQAEIALMSSLARTQREQLDELRPLSPELALSFRQVIGGAWETLIGRSLPGSEEVSLQQVEESTDEGVTLRRGVIEFAKHEERIPAVVLSAAMTTPKSAVVWISPEGKSAVEENGSPRPIVRSLLSAGHTVLGVDLLHQGSARGEKPIGAVNRVMENERQAACFVFGYNHPLFAQRVHDILSALAYARQLVGQDGVVKLVGVPGGAAWTAAAGILARETLDRLALHTDGFRFAQIVDIEDPHLLPGAVKYGDLPALLALLAPMPVWVHGESPDPESLPVTMYRTSQQPLNLVFDIESPMGSLERMARWLVA